MMPQPEVLAEGVTRYWLDDRRIVAFALKTSASREAIDAWVGGVKETLFNWQQGQPYLTLYDLSHAEIFITPYARQHLYELSRTMPGLSGRTAIIMRESLGGRIAQGFLRVIGTKGARERRLFFNYADGLAWLRELL